MKRLNLMNILQMYETNDQNWNLAWMRKSKNREILAGSHVKSVARPYYAICYFDFKC